MYFLIQFPIGKFKVGCALPWKKKFKFVIQSLSWVFGQNALVSQYPSCCKCVSPVYLTAIAIYFFFSGWKRCLMEPTCSAILASRRERPKSLKRIVINEGKSCLSKYKKSLKGNAWSQVRDRDDCWKISSIGNKSVDLSVKKCIESKNNQNRKKVKVCLRTLLAFLL